MGNVLDNISKDNTRFTIFENNQVLTADQLNDLFNYLDVQTRLTRTRAIGVGIICGLEIGLLDNKNVVISRGAAITTDGDLLQFDTDQQFDQFDVFEDLNAKYPYFHLDTNQPIPLFELRKSQVVGSVPGKDLATLEESTGTVFKDYAGILYLEDYDNDPDLCTGTDCDNKGATAVKELKVLLVHKNNVRTLLQSMPTMNKDYFSLDDLNIPRVVVSTAIDTVAELNASFNNVLAIKEEIKAKLTNAYKVCQLIVEDEFESGDPTTGWATQLDQVFTEGVSTATQYVFDFARDISYAYNEMRESVFSDDMLCCPDVDLFPKHVLLGLIRDASVKNPIISFPDRLDFPLRDINPINTGNLTAFLNPNLLFFKNIRFNLGNILKRFHKIHIDLEYRHHFYESPILNSNNDIDELTRFCFMRIHSMITNFKVPTAEEVQNLESGLRITPSFYEDAPLGERSIPFYYRFNANLPLNLFWNFNANNRKRENKLLWYHALNNYAVSAPVSTPLKFNLLPFNFFRIEGHIGFNLTDVEAALNKLILDNNLPINIQAVQVEKRFETIPHRRWFFPHLYMYEKSLKSTFIDRLDDADLVNDNLRAKDQTIPVTEFKTAKQNVLDNARDIGDPQFNFMSYRSAITNVMSATTNVKAQTRKYTFSNTATPHDFILNADILRKTDVISSIYQDTILKKKTGLMLGNYMKDNPGLEHAGGVMRGGTFVIVYTADDQRVVADFMLPYASIDKDVIPNPPVYVPPIPLPTGPPIIPHFPIDDIFEFKPNYMKDFEEKIVPYVKETDFDIKMDLKFNPKIAEIEGRFNPKFAELESKFDSKLAITNTKMDVFSSVITKDFRKDAVPNTGTIFGTKNLTNEVENFNRNRKVLEDTPMDAPGRDVLEKNVVDSAEDLTVKLNDQVVMGDEANSLVVKSILADVHSSTSLIQNLELKGQAATIADRANTINRGFKFNR